MTSVSSRRTRRPQWPRSHSIRGSWWISLTECCRYLLQLFLVKNFLCFSLVSNYTAPNSREVESTWCYLFMFLSLFAPVAHLCLTPPRPFPVRCWSNRRFRGKVATLSKWTKNISVCSWTPFSLNSMLPPSSRWVCPNFPQGINSCLISSLAENSCKISNTAKMGSAHVAILISTLFSKGGTVLCYDMIWYDMRIYSASNGRICLESLVLITL